MNFRRLSDKELADFGANVLTLLGGTQLESIGAALRASLVTAVGTLPADLSAKSAAAGIAETARMSAVSSKNGSRELLIAAMSQVKNALIVSLAPKDQYDLCGFDFREPVAGPYIAQAPTDLSASGYSNGVNLVKFKGNNRSGAVVYEIWRRQGDSGAWGLLATTRKQSFTDTPVTPGQFYEYKTRATASRSISHFSNSAVVYGAA